MAKNIIARRKARGWTAMELSKEAKLPYATVRDIEAGVSGGWAITREKIAKALGCTEPDLHAVKESNIDDAVKILTDAIERKGRFAEVPSDILEALAAADDERLDRVRLVLRLPISKRPLVEKKKA